MSKNKRTVVCDCVVPVSAFRPLITQVGGFDAWPHIDYLISEGLLELALKQLKMHLEQHNDACPHVLPYPDSIFRCEAAHQIEQVGGCNLVVGCGYATYNINRMYSLYPTTAKNNLEDLHILPLITIYPKD